MVNRLARFPRLTASLSSVSVVLVLVLVALQILPPADQVSAADNRLFTATGYRVTNDAFFNYFEKRGGARTFGYPVSREFSLLGSKIQIFQRQVMQQRPDGTVGLLNILDREHMPYSKINGTSLPAFDPAITAGSPTPGSANYDRAVVDFVHDRAPDVWQGLPVKFWTAFNATVSLKDAYPLGDGDPALLPLLALEIWGLPTSQPAFDPNNRSFVYLRFQRGVMQYDSTTGLTQGLLLADSMKAILTGSGLPADLDRDSKGSAYYKQYDKQSFRSISRPAQLPLSDLSYAFERDDSSGSSTIAPVATATSAAGATSTPTTGGVSTIGGGPGTGSGSAIPTATPYSTISDPTASSVSNDRYVVNMQIGGAEHAKIKIRTAEGELKAWSVPTLLLKSGQTVFLGSHTSTESAITRVTAVTEPYLGSGKKLEVELKLKDGSGTVRTTITLFDNKNYLTLRMTASGFGSDRAPTTFRLFDGEGGGWLSLGTSSTYFAEDLELKRGTISGSQVDSQLIPGKPLLFSDSRSSTSFVLSTIDANDYFLKFSAKYASDHSGTRFIYEATNQTIDSSGDVSSPRMFIDLPKSTDSYVALSAFRTVVSDMYPSPRLPDWLKLGWTTSHGLGIDFDELGVRRQIDFIADNLADLGGWYVVVDGGWFKADARTDSDGRKVDSERFPSGMRSLVDYAHRKGVRVVLTLPGPYVDDIQQRGNRAGLRTLINTHRDWLTEVGTDGEGSRFVYDPTSPGFRSWWSDLVREVLVTYDADGIRLDGYGQALNYARKDTKRARLQSGELYRYTAEQAWAAKSNAYIESGWYVPVYANPFVHQARWTDETMTFEHEQPKSGLRQHLDYSLYQRIGLNQRPHLGDVYGMGTQGSQSMRWIEAALGLGAQTAISENFTQLEEGVLSNLRARLFHYNANRGSTTALGGLDSDVFATTVDDLTYVGVINRTGSRKTPRVKLSDVGLSRLGATVRDVSSGQSSQITDGFTADVPASSIRLYIIRQNNGVMWTNSSVTTDRGSTHLKLTVKGPTSVRGFVESVSSRPSSVTLDGQTLTGSGYTYDQTTGILRIEYSHDRSHEIRVEFSSDGSPGTSLP